MPIFKAPNNDTCIADLAPTGWTEIAQDELDEIRQSRIIPAQPPTPLQQIRALEAQYADAQARVTRQALLSLALEKATLLPEAAGLTQAQVHGILMLQDNGYQALFTLEQQVEVLRAQTP